MKLPDRIVVGLALDRVSCAPSEGSRAAAETALWLAEKAEGSHVTLVHSVVEDEYYDPLVDELVPICGNVDPASRLAVSELVARFRAHGVPCETVDTAERPSLAITREVNSQRAQLVLVGKHDGREADAARIGPIALRVLRESPCAVWSVAPERKPKPRCVLAATDLTATGDAAVEWAALVARASGAALHAVHVHPPALHSRGASSKHHLDELAACAVAPLPADLRVSVRVHLREAAPAQGVLSLAEELEADLVVMGTFSHRRDEPHHIGSTTERMITRFGGSLLLVRAR